MSAKTVPPTLGAKSFTCPHCGAISHQNWYRPFIDSYNKDSGPWIPDPSIIEDIRQNRNFESENKAKFIKFFERMLAKELFLEVHASNSYLDTELSNLSVSRCYSCDAFSLWVSDDLIYPEGELQFQPNEEMPSDVLLDFEEAASIIDKSARGAAALLRLAIQRLMPHLGQKGKSLDDDIGELVKQGLDGRIQKALDVVRVVGNNAVHPGQIDLRDNKTTAIELFRLVNLIVEAMIATPKHIEEMYGSLPEGARKAIEKRDGSDAI